MGKRNAIVKLYHVLNVAHKNELLSFFLLIGNLSQILDVMFLFPVSIDFSEL